MGGLCDINFSLFFNLILTEWKIKDDCTDYVRGYERELDQKLHDILGIQRVIQMEG